ncbi:hypothetical protein [Marivirga lumbricoides]|uniref:hypothetical protein n=1 Tax=Marivirga lumbricoides TaxID=1046115 RepID=UPI00166C4591
MNDIEFLKESQTYIAQFYVNKENKWGRMEASRWDSFLHWLIKNKLITKKEETLLAQQTLYTNKYLS